MNRLIRWVAAAFALLLVQASAQDRSGRSSRRTEKASGTESAAMAEPATKSEGFEAYQNVRAKNIFDPSRRGPRIETPANAAPAAPTNRSRTLALTGTMVTDGKSLAFFSGSAAEGSRVISVGSSVSNYKVTAIAPTQVSLEQEGKSLTLEVGRQITFEGSSGAPGAPTAAAPVVEPVQEPAADTTGAPSVPGPAGDKSEILRRMMERRAKEGGK